MTPLAQAPGELTGLAGWAARVMDALGEAGVGLLVALENLFPPVPSEVILPLAGLLAAQGRMQLLLAVAAATVGSVVGALVLYEAGARLGRERVARLVDRLPLVDVEDLERAEGWFARHGRSSVLFGRWLPMVRSLVSVPAGVERMPRGLFLACTAVGSLVWNAAFVYAGYALATQFSRLETVNTVLDVVLYVLLGVAALWLLRRVVQRRRADRARLDQRG